MATPKEEATVKKPSKVREKLAALDWRIAIAAIVVIGGLEAYALACGRDGYLFSFAVIAIAGIAGFKLRRPL